MTVPLSVIISGAVESVSSGVPAFTNRNGFQNRHAFWNWNTFQNRDSGTQERDLQN